MKRAEYVLSESFLYRIDMHDSIELPKYSHVIPIDERWVPKEVKDKIGPLIRGNMYVYTKHGILIVPEKIVRLA